jgi:hypothetical protein
MEQSFQISAYVSRVHCATKFGVDCTCYNKLCRSTSVYGSENSELSEGSWMSLQAVSKSMGEENPNKPFSKLLVQYGTNGTFNSFCCKDLDVTLSTVGSCFISVFYSVTQFVQSKC